MNFNISPSEWWNISTEGIRLVRGLARQECWSEVSRIYHSPENKAVATARIVSEITGISTKVADDLRELRTPFIRPADEFLRRVGAYLTGMNDPEFESLGDATDRIVHCVQDLVRNEIGKSVAIVSHGKILTVLFGHILKRHLTLDEWQSMGMPALSVIDLESWTVERGFFSTRAIS